MKFREYKKLDIIIIKDHDEKELIRKIKNFGECYDIIDIQYSSTNIGDNQMNIEYSVLILYKIMD